MLLYVVTAAGVILSAWKATWGTEWHFPLMLSMTWLLLVVGTGLAAWQCRLKRQPTA